MGQMASTAFVINVVELFKKQIPFNHEFTMVLDMDYDSFADNVTKQVKFFEHFRFLYYINYVCDIVHC